VDDVRALGEPVLRHRVLTNFHAEAEGVDSRAVVAQLLRDARMTLDPALLAPGPLQYVRAR